MSDNSLTKLGGICSVLVGVSYVLLGITYLGLPVRPGGDNFRQFLEAFNGNTTVYTIYYWEFALGAVLALAAVPAISQLVRSANEGWVRWTTNLAYLGFAVVAISFFRMVALMPGRAAAYVAGDASTQAALEAIGSAGLDPQGWLGFGGVGLWILVVSLLALRGNTLPKLLAYTGIAATITYWFVVAGFMLGIPVLFAIAAGLGGVVLAPIWYIWIGLRLRRAGS